MKLDYTELGIRIQSQRRRCKITQSDMAKKLGITPSQVSHIETGVTRPSLDVVAGICSVLGVSADELIFGTPASPTRPFPGKLEQDASSDMISSEEDAHKTTDYSELGNYLLDCPKMDQEVILDMVSLMKKGLLAARLSAYNAR